MTSRRADAGSAPPLKVLMTSAAADRYGADVLLRHVAAHLLRSGADVDIVLPVHGPAEDALRAEGLAVRTARSAVVRRVDMHPRGALRLIAAMPVALASHLRQIRRGRVDVVWVNTVSVPLWVIAGWIMRRRVVVHCHEIVAGSRLGRRLTYGPLHLAAEVIVVSDACRDDIATVYPRLAERVRVMTNRSFEVVDELPLDDPASNDIVMIGRISSRKGQLVLLEALHDLSLRDPMPTVHICGDAYPPDSATALAYKQEVVDQAARSPIPVQVHGFLRQSLAMRLGPIVVVPSVDPEPWSLVVSEAMTAGRAVIASDSGGIREQLAGRGILVPPGDAKALGAALQSVLDSPEMRADMMARAREWATQSDLDGYYDVISAVAWGTARPGSR